MSVFTMNCHYKFIQNVDFLPVVQSDYEKQMNKE